jgi:hypothetical protein
LRDDSIAAFSSGPRWKPDWKMISPVSRPSLPRSSFQRSTIAGACSGSPSVHRPSPYFAAISTACSPKAET